VSLGEAAGSRTLLVADDELAHRDLIRMIVGDTALPVRLVTARDGEEAVALPGDAAQALAAGCDAYITKPIEVPALRALLERYF
jgi:CheY-like chemotaxis protein